MDSNLFKLALINSRPYLSNVSKFEKILSELQLEKLSTDKQINLLQTHESDDIQVKTDINIFIRNLEKLKKII